MNPIEQRIRKNFEAQAFMRLIGARLEKIEKGKVTLAFDFRQDLSQQLGSLHAGVLASVADVACGCAALSVMPEDCDVVSVEFKINHLRPGLGKTFIVTGEVIKAGRSLVITEAEVRNKEDGKLISKMLATMFPK